jgi:hypothetical protein
MTPCRLVGGIDVSEQHTGSFFYPENTGSTYRENLATTCQKRTVFLGLWKWSHVFDPKAVRRGFVVYDVELVQFFLPVLQIFLQSVIPPMPLLMFHSSTGDAIQTISLATETVVM